MHHDGLVPQPLFLMGEPPGAAPSLERHQAARRVLPVDRGARRRRRGAVRKLDRPTAPAHGRRRGYVRPSTGLAQRLHAGDIDDLNRLYQLGFRAGFAQAILENAVYYGIASAAGW